MLALLILHARERWSIHRRMPRLGQLLRCVGYACVAIVLVPAGLGAAYLCLSVEDPRLGRALVGWLLLLIFGAWFVGGAVFSMPFSGSIRLSPSAVLPIQFRSLYLANFLAGFTGLWWLCFAPALAVLAIRAGLRGWLAILLFVPTCTRLVEIGRTYMAPFTRSWRQSAMLWVLFMAGSYLVLSLVFHIPTDLTALRRLDPIHLLSWTPPGAVAACLTDGSSVFLGILALWLIALIALERRLLFRNHFHGDGNRRTAPPARLLLWVAGRNPWVSSIIREIFVLLRLRPFRLVYLFGLAYFFVFPRVIPAVDLDATYLVVLGSMPFLFLHAAAGNALGIDFRSIRDLLAMPIPARDLVLHKIQAVVALAISLSGLLLGSAALVGKLPPASSFLTAFLFGLSAIVLWCGSHASCRFPYPTDLRRQYSVGNDPGSMMTLFMILAWTVGSLIVLRLLARPTLVECLFSVLVWAGFHRFGLTHLNSRLKSHRDEILNRLATAGS